MRQDVRPLILDRYRRPETKSGNLILFLGAPAFSLPRAKT